MALSSGLSKLGPRALLAGAAGAFGSLDTAVNVAFPDLVDDFGLAVGDLQWVVGFYVLSSDLQLSSFPSTARV